MCFLYTPKFSCQDYRLPLGIKIVYNNFLYHNTLHVSLIIKEESIMLTKEEFDERLQQIAKASELCLAVSREISAQPIRYDLHYLFRQNNALLAKLQRSAESFQIVPYSLNREQFIKLLGDGSRHIMELADTIRTQQAPTISALDLVEQQGLNHLFEVLEEAWFAQLHAKEVSCQWAFKGITCYCVSENGQSYYEIRTDPPILKDENILEQVQGYLEQLDTNCAMENKTLRHSMNCVTRLCLSISDQNEVDALKKKIGKLTGIVRLLKKSSDIGGISQSSSSSSSSSSSFSSNFFSSNDHKVMLVRYAEETTINKIFIGGKYRHIYPAPAPVLTEAAQRITTQILEYPSEVYEVWGSIPDKHPYFVGRNDVLQSIADRFTVVKSQPNLVTTDVRYQIITGLGGVGKTQLAAAYAHLCFAARGIGRSAGHPFTGLPYNATVWINAGDEAQLLASFEYLAEQVGLILDQGSDNGISRVREKLYARLANLPRVLLIFDDVIDENSIKEHLPQPGTTTWANTCHCLLTTRYRHWAEKTYDLVPLSMFSPQETEAYLMNAIQLFKLQDREHSLRVLSSTLGNLPLALAAAVTYIKVQDVIELTSMDPYNKRLALFCSLPAGNDDYLNTLLTAWMTSIIDMTKTKRDYEALHLFLVAGFLSGQSIKKSLLSACLKKSCVRVNTLVDYLSRYSFIEQCPEQTVQVHELVQEVLQYWLKGDLRRYLAESRGEANDWLLGELDRIEEYLTKQNIPHTWIDMGSAIQPHLKAFATHLDGSASMDDESEIIPGSFSCL